MMLSLWSVYFACLGVLQAYMTLGLWSAHLASEQDHESQVALFSSNSSM